MASQKLENIEISRDLFLNEIKKVQNREIKVECKKKVTSIKDPSLYAKECRLSINKNLCLILIKILQLFLLV